MKNKKNTTLAIIFATLGMASNIYSMEKQINISLVENQLVPQGCKIQTHDTWHMLKNIKANLKKNIHQDLHFKIYLLGLITDMERVRYVSPQCTMLAGQYLLVNEQSTKNKKIFMTYVETVIGFRHLEKYKKYEQLLEKYRTQGLSIKEVNEFKNQTDWFSYERLYVANKLAKEILGESGLSL